MPYPPIEPYRTGTLDTGDGNLVYWEACGNPDGRAALVVHGGPGSGCSPGQRRQFDPERYHIVLFDQRNCGRSRPLASEPSTDLSRNTTAHLVSDMEALRELLGVDAWVLFGGSWGVTLSLAYAQAHPDRIAGMLLVSVTTGRRSELNWLYRGVGRIFPEAWSRFRDHAGAAGHLLPTDTEPPVEELLSAYGRMLADPDPRIRARAAAEWLTWEDAVISMERGGASRLYSERPDDAQQTFARLCAHYFANACFLDDGAVMRDAGRLAGIPGELVHGRADLGGPVIIPWELARAWPDANLVVVAESGHTGNEIMQRELDAAAERLHARLR